MNNDDMLDEWTGCMTTAFDTTEWRLAISPTTLKNDRYSNVLRSLQNERNDHQKGKVDESNHEFLP